MSMDLIHPLLCILIILLLKEGMISNAQVNVTNTTIPSSASDIIKVCATSVKDPSFNQACQDELYSDVQQTVDAYTISFSKEFSFCVADPIEERDATFGFQGNLSFLTECFDKTSGSFMQYMCTSTEIKMYISSLTTIIQGSANDAASATILDSNCNKSRWTKGCEAGWSKSLSEVVLSMSDLYRNDTTVAFRSDLADIPCCDGFFCPRGLGCMMPCPLGAVCTSANLTGGLCSPYDYPLTPGADFSCGGANLWASLSVASGIFCPAGSYCPSTTNQLTCDRGHFCRQGSTVQSKCFRLTNCDEQSKTQHIQSYGIIIIVGLVVSVVIIYNCSNQVRHVRRKRKEKIREKAIKQVRENLSVGETWLSQISRTFTGVPRRGMGSKSFVMLSSGRASTRPRLGGNIHNAGEINNYNYEMAVIGETNGKTSHLSDAEEDLYFYNETSSVVSEGASSSNRNKKKKTTFQTGSQIMRYAYGEIEKEKAAAQKRPEMRWDDVVRIGEEQAKGDRLKIEITFQDLSLFLKGNGKKILCNVTGKLSPGRVTAVMGPSGAGKTTFLNALAGKAYSSYTTGTVLINGKPDPIKCYKKVIGFVPQDDIVHGNLTVEENIWFSANYRLPAKMPKQDKVLVVERIIDSLGLEQIRSSKVGTVQKRGISGGQRKRVNVGLEMVMEPSLLILDEPTSGLDSTSSFLVLRALRREAYVGVNVGVVLHQPSYGLFKMFDDVMLLAKGGKTVYLGPVDEVEDYFASMGIVVPERINPPDHYMDVLEGMAKPSAGKRLDPSILPIKWMQHKGYTIPNDFQASIPETDAAAGLTTKEGIQSSRNNEREKNFIQDAWSEFTNFLKNHWDEFKSTFTRYEDLSNRKTPWFWPQFRMIISRLILQRIREARVQTQDGLILLLCGACLGVIAPTTDSSLGSNSYAYVIIALSLLCMIASLRTFTNDKLEYWRESSSGINKVAYFLAKDTVDHFNTVIKPVVFLSMFYFFNNSRSTFVENYVVTLALVYCVTGIAYIFAITMDSGPAQLWSVFLPIILTLVATKKDMPSILKYLPYADYANWALQAYIIANAKRYSGVWLITRCALLYSTNYNINNWALSLAVLFCMGFATRVIALLCLILCNRKRQQ